MPASKNTPKRDQTAIFESLGYDTTPDVRVFSAMDKPRHIFTNRAVLAEFFAMTLFVWVGCGTAVSSQALLGFNPDDTRENTFLLAVSTAFGFGISVLAYTVAPISGGHINPAVTFAFWLVRDIDWVMALAYIVAQVLGAFLGAAIVWGCSVSYLLSLDTTDGESETAPPYLIGSNSVTASYPLGSAFLIECMGTFLLVWTVLLTAVSKISIAGNLAPIAIGWSVLLAHLVLIPFTGCGINPARSFGPHIVILCAGYKAGTRGWWIYYTAPWVGAAAAALVTKYIFGVRNVANPVTQETMFGDDEDEQQKEKDVVVEGDDEKKAAGDDEGEGEEVVEEAK